MSGGISVTITRVKGSAPRGAGTTMRIFETHQTGTIGGGRLEFEATRIARAMLARGDTDATRRFPLGPDLGQCCGGMVDLSFTAVAPQTQHSAAPLWIWGAGHVGRAIVQVMAPLQDREITWIDTGPDRFPDHSCDAVPDCVSPLVAADLPRAVPHAARDAHHLILTYSHDFDLALCDALLRHGFGFCGLIGSATKWARFSKRLAAMGHTPAQIAAITCPIGDPALGKHPAAIAVGVAAQLMTLQPTPHTAPRPQEPASA